MARPDYPSLKNRHCQDLDQQLACDTERHRLRLDIDATRVTCAPRAHVRDHGWFFKPQLFSIKIILWKRGTFQLSNATNFSSIRQNTAKLQEFKVERLGDQFVTVTMGKSRFDGTKRLAFPPWQRFICIHSDRLVPEIDEDRLELLRFPFRSPRAPCPVLVCLFGHMTKEPCAQR